MLLVLQLILLTDYSILNGIRVDSIPSITEKAVRIPPRTAFHLHTLLFSAFQAEGILSLIAAPQNPIAIIATAAMPNNTFFIELFLSLSLNLDYSFSIPLNY